MSKDNSFLNTLPGVENLPLMDWQYYQFKKYIFTSQISQITFLQEPTAPQTPVQYRQQVFTLVSWMSHTAVTDFGSEIVFCLNPITALVYPHACFVILFFIIKRICCYNALWKFEMLKNILWLVQVHKMSQYAFKTFERYLHISRFSLVL